MKLSQERKNYRRSRRWKYGDNPSTNPAYIKDRDELFRQHGNGWWWKPDKTRQQGRPDKYIKKGK